LIEPPRWYWSNHLDDIDRTTQNRQLRFLVTKFDLVMAAREALLCDVDSVKQAW